MGLEKSNATVQWTVAGEGWTEPNLNLLPSGADANESLPAYHISRLTLIELDGNFLYTKQRRNTHFVQKQNICRKMAVLECVFL